jgi:hypothetical protein
MFIPGIYCTGNTGGRHNIEGTTRGGTVGEPGKNTA